MDYIDNLGEIGRKDYIPVPEELYAEQLQKKIVYNWDTNIIILRDKYNNNYNIRLRGDYNIISGDSGIGKSYMCQRIKQIQSQSGIGDTWNADNIVIIDHQNKEYLGQFKQKLIIIDNAETLINYEDENVIVETNEINKNRFIFITNRNLWICPSPNYEGQLIRTPQNNIELWYETNKKEWFCYDEQFDGTGWYEPLHKEISEDSH